MMSDFVGHQTCRNGINDDPSTFFSCLHISFYLQLMSLSEKKIKSIR